MIVTERVLLQPKYLTNKYNDHITRLLNKKLKKKCKKDIGYILNIVKIISVKQVLTNTPDVIFEVACEIETFLPKVNDITDAKVIFCTSQGLTLTAHEVDKIFLPNSNLTGYNFSNGSFVSESDVIKKGDILKVVLIAVRFNATKDYTSICRLLKKI